MSVESLIYGKDDTSGIVSIEIDNDEATVFIQDIESGQVWDITCPNSFWIMSPEKLDESCIRFDGDLYYKWIQFMDTSRVFHQRKKLYREQYKTFHINDHKEAFMVMSGMTYFKNLQHKQVSTLAFDIETVGLEFNKDSKILLIANTFRNSSGNVERKLFSYDDYEGPKELLDAWCTWVCEKDPTIMLGHNIYNYDLPYITHCASLCGAELLLGRKGKGIFFNSYTSKFRKDGSQFYDYTKCYIYGREIVDTMFLAIKYDVGRKYESYGLKAIIKHEDLEAKDRQFYDAGQIRFKYEDKEEWKKIKAYAEQDGDDALALYDLMSPPFFYTAQTVPKSFQEINTSATGAQINSVMVRAYLQESHSIPVASMPESFEGAISLGNPGIWRNVMKVDVASLYPSIMIQYEIYDNAKDPKGYFKQLVNTFTERRLEHKKLAKTDKYYDDLQNSEKIFINSCYGFLGAKGLVFNSPKNAALITKKGREVLETALFWAAEKQFHIANADTDSISFSRELEISAVEQEFLLKDLNSLYPDKIHFEHDGYFPTVIVLKAKNYIIYDGKKIKTKGSALRDQKKEQGLKDFQNEIISAMIHNDGNMADIYHKYVKEILNVTDIKRWSSKKTITEKVFSSERTNETKVADALVGSDYKEADKIWLFFKSDDSLCLAEKFDGDYNKDRLLKKLFMSAQVFENVLSIKDMFLNYSLKRNKKALEVL